MTLENCKRLLAHYEGLVSGSIEPPQGHKNWNKVVKNAKGNLAEMKARILRKESEAFLQKEVERRSKAMLPPLEAPKKEKKPKEKSLVDKAKDLLK